MAQRDDVADAARCFEAFGQSPEEFAAEAWHGDEPPAYFWNGPPVDEERLAVLAPYAQQAQEALAAFEAEPDIEKLAELRGAILAGQAADARRSTARRLPRPACRPVARRVARPRPRARRARSRSPGRSSDDDPSSSDGVARVREVAA